MRKLFRWPRRNFRKEDPEPIPVQEPVEEEEPLAPLTRREKAKAMWKVLHKMDFSYMSESEKQLLAILADYAADMPIPLIATRHHCSDTTVNRRINAALQRRYGETQ